MCSSSSLPLFLESLSNKMRILWKITLFQLGNGFFNQQNLFGFGNFANFMGSTGLLTD
jgi:hypothetical protein